MESVNPTALDSIRLEPQDGQQSEQKIRHAEEAVTPVSATIVSYGSRQHYLKYTGCGSLLGLIAGFGLGFAVSSFDEEFDVGKFLGASVGLSFVCAILFSICTLSACAEKLQRKQNAYATASGLTYQPEASAAPADIEVTLTSE